MAFASKQSLWEAYLLNCNDVVIAQITFETTLRIILRSVTHFEYA